MAPPVPAAVDEVVDEVEVVSMHYDEDILEVSSENSKDTPHPQASKWYKLSAKGGDSYSEIWHYFHLIDGIRENVTSNHIAIDWKFRACCNLCSSAIKAYQAKNKHQPHKMRPMNGGLESHLKRHHGLTLNKVIDTSSSSGSKRQLSILKWQLNSKHPKIMNGTQLRQQVIDATTTRAVSCNIPFSMVDRPEFRAMITANNP